MVTNNLNPVEKSFYGFLNYKKKSVLICVICGYIFLYFLTYCNLCNLRNLRIISFEVSFAQRLYLLDPIKPGFQVDTNA
jgi:hypothetical protein